MKIKTIALSGVIAAIYVVFTIMPPFSLLSFGMVQFRISEVLMVLSLFTPAGVLGTTVGCLLSNLIGAGNLFDIIFGTLATFLAGFTIYKLRDWFMNKKILMPLPVIILNGLIIGSYLPFILSKVESFTALFNAIISGNSAALISQGVAPIGICMLSVAVGEAGVMYLLGVPFAVLIEQKKIFLKF